MYISASIDCWSRYLYRIDGIQLNFCGFINIQRLEPNVRLHCIIVCGNAICVERYLVVMVLCCLLWSAEGTLLLDNASLAAERRVAPGHTLVTGLLMRAHG